MANKDNALKTIWVDLLCWRSALKLIFLLRRISVDKIYYANTTVFFQPFIGPLARLVRKPIIQILEIAESEEKIAGVSLYECIQLRLENILDHWADSERIAKRAGGFCRENVFNAEKYKAHLKEAAYSHLFRPIEIAVLAEKISGKENALYLLRRTPFYGLLKNILEEEKVFFYNTLFLSRKSVIKRHDYIYDASSNDDYYASKVSSVGKMVIQWLAASFWGMLSPLFRKTSGEIGRNNIGVELLQSRIRLDEINELFWLKDSGIDPKTVITIEMEDFDADSSDVLKSLGVKRVKPFENLKKTARSLMTKRSSDQPCDFIFPDGGYGLRTLPLMLQLYWPLMAWNEMSWIRFQEVRYICRTLFWMSIYKSLGVRILWSMIDMDEDKLAKAQALEKLDGLYAGGQWSNSPMYVVLAQKCFDVMFTWGEHFIKNNFNRYPFLDIFKVGYPSDHYFESRRAKAAELKDQYPGKYILSYQDNTMSNDVGCSWGMQVGIHKMLVSILGKYPDVVVFLKPKRKYYFQDIVKAVPGLQELIDQKRAVAFFGETLRTKAVPAEIGMASDLVIGLIIGAAASECFFAGTVAFHADLTGFVHNQFAHDGLGEVVFRDVESLTRAVEDRICGRDQRRHGDFRKYYETLDPFQDGKAYRRTGFLVEKLQAGLRQGLSREEAVIRARKEYDSYLRSKIDLGNGSAFSSRLENKVLLS